MADPRPIMQMQTSITHNLTIPGLRTWLRRSLDAIQDQLPDTGRPQSFTQDVYLVVSSPANPDPTADIPQRSELPHGRMVELISEMPNSKTPLSGVEADFALQAHGQGWTVSKKGWPDFFLTRPISESEEPRCEIACVELMPRRTRRLRKHQRAVMLALASYGVPCYRWAPSSGYDRIGLIQPQTEEIPAK